MRFLQVEEAKRAVLGLMAQKDGNKTGSVAMGKPTIEVSVSLPYEVLIFIFIYFDLFVQGVRPRRVRRNLAHANMLNFVLLNHRQFERTYTAPSAYMDDIFFTKMDDIV